MKYKNLTKAEQEDKELAELEAEYIRQNSEQPVATEEDVPPVVNKEEETWKERYSNLKSYADKNRNEDKKRIADLEARLVSLEKEKTKSSVDLPVSVDEAREWVQKYPQLAGTLKALWREDIEYLKEELGAGMSELEETRREIHRQKAFAEVLKAHPDFPQIMETQEFQDWVDRQPEEKDVIGQAIYDALRKNLDPNPAIKAISIYKSETNQKPKRELAREAVQSVPRNAPSTPRDSGDKNTFSESQVEKMSSREFEKYEEAIDQAKREGRFIYDISGAAR